jgi:hypothetical protein
MTMADHDDSTISSEAVVGSSDMATQVCSALFLPTGTLFLVDSHPVTHAGSSRMCLDPDVVPPLAGFRLYAILGVFHHFLFVPPDSVPEHCLKLFL